MSGEIPAQVSVQGVCDLVRRGGSPRDIEWMSGRTMMGGWAGGVGCLQVHWSGDLDSCCPGRSRGGGRQNQGCHVVGWRSGHGPG